MSFSIGSTGANMGPRGALERFGEEVDERAIDWRTTGWRVIVRLLAYLRPYWRRMSRPSSSCSSPPLSPWPRRIW